MYCPQCGQQQNSEETRFCSRCGFPLSGVIGLLAGGGVPAISDASASQGKLSPRRRGYRQGLLMLFIGAILTPILGVLSNVGMPDIFIALSAIIFFWGGIIRMIYARVFEEKATYGAHDVLPAYSPPANPAQFGAGARQAALPPQRSSPATGWRQPTNTAEVALPSSVTENTTRLLDDNVEPPRR